MKRKKVTTSVNYCPEELLREILVRLPAKSLLRFLCVSKGFCKMIEDPEFISMHMKTYKKNKERNLVLTMETVEDRTKLIIRARHRDSFRRCGSGRLFETWVKDKFVFGGEFFCASIDGLVLVERSSEVREKTFPVVVQSSSSRFRVFTELVTMLEVWNPYIRKTLVLPPFHFKRASSAGNFSLGFAPSTNDYKVGIFDFENYKRFQPWCSIYSFRRGCWMTTALDVIAKGNWWISDEFVSSKRATHWLTTEVITKKYDRASYTHITSFDFDVEEISFTKLPKMEEGMLPFPFIVDDSLAIFGISLTSIKIWVFGKDCGEEPWIVWYCGGSTPKGYYFFRSCSGMRNRLQKILYMKNKAGDNIFLINTQERVYSFDLNSHKVCTYGRSISSPRLIDAYMESLLLCRGLEGNLTSPPGEGL